ncbi:acyltransferase family protein [Acinetobacter faecalis]|uniref:acyltransferase family protein n=1 Tax=Acinetobacter faecalis TaxID=2665161 RepID=UPI002A917A96|nr:acyltransferase family protein [Acinetobacter faecalis]MDY6481798.1 acyltransferase family protein [Acinetobacter faecalis]
MNFRHDINGLRAIAVLAVVIFHFNPQWLPGGFAGVDVFFVISGFLMTSIIFNGVEKNTFNLFKFYNARANRIIPVLAAMSAVLLVFGWFYIIPSEYEKLAKQVERSAVFISNIMFSKGGGYFDTAEHTKWLLHTWSLSVEWQFYIFFPIIILFLKKYIKFQNLKHVVLGLFAASFIYCVYATFKDSKTAYFLLSTRAWEMLLGGLAFLYPLLFKNKPLQISTQCLGLVLIIVSYFFISDDTLWPGYMALIPVFGAYLIVLSNYQNNIVINNPIFGHIGKWSYSIYVWHWPLVVLGFYFSFENWWIYGIPLSLLLGFLSYQFIEKINFPRYSSWREIYKVKPFYIFLIIFLCGYTIKVFNGFPEHYPAKIQNILKEEDNSNPYSCRNVNEDCFIGNSQNIKAIVIGDSHADSVATAVASAFNGKDEGIMTMAMGGCPFVINANIDVSGSECPDLNKNRLQLIQSSKYENIPIILIARFPIHLLGENDLERTGRRGPTPLMYFEKNEEKRIIPEYSLFEKNLTETLCFTAQNHPTYILQPIPELGLNAPRELAKNILNGRNTDTNLLFSSYLKRTNQIREIINHSSKKCNVTVLDPSSVLCNDNKCISTYKGRPIYRDGDHLSEYGNKLLTPMFKDALNP